MSKTLKSVKIDNELMEIIDEYTALMKSVCGSASTFTSMVEEGITLSLIEQINLLGMFAGSPIMMEDGTLKKIQIPADNRDKLNRFEAMLHCYRAKNNMGNVSFSSECIK